MRDLLKAVFTFFVVIFGFFLGFIGGQKLFDTFNERSEIAEVGIPNLLESEKTYEVRIFVENLQGGGKTFIAKELGGNKSERYYSADIRCSKTIPDDLALPIVLTTLKSDKSGELECLWLQYPKK